MHYSDQYSPGMPDIHLMGDVPSGTHDEQEETLLLMQRLLAEHGSDAPRGISRIFAVQKLTGGRSGALVVKATPVPAHGDGSARPSVVLKITSCVDGLEEKANYDRYVHQGLPVGARAALLGFAKTQEHAGLCYTFVGGDGPKVDTLTDELRRGDTRSLTRFLTDFFQPLRNTWYNPRAIVQESDVVGRYRDRYFSGEARTHWNEPTLLACARRYFAAEQSEVGCRVDGIIFPSPRKVLLDRGAVPYRACVIHGDLNTDNVIVADDGSMKVVDFLKTGRGHVYEDLVALEASVRINYPSEPSFGEIWNTERMIATDTRTDRDDPYARCIHAVRATAVDCFGYPNDEAYHFAVAAIGFRLMQAQDLSHAARARITASALWAAKMLVGDTQH
ncbi:phosphotransferase [Sphingobium subterraneum]|uniref:Ternary complex associated domain-containing protein n=1 Tax=Sphingobium subterraneum TaxID=627688 RepID=A0A841J580_9SPHN|nr:phosphotransferase [Sphingobium subterraneum]MBB6123381.1 hypothetical protein [Sphingobium subterraneum]